MSLVIVPIHATNVPEDLRDRTELRVALRVGDDIVSETVSLKRGTAEARFEVEGGRPVTIAVGPEATPAAELFNKSTPTISITPRFADDQWHYAANPIVVTEPIWRFWLRWCRSFTISGYLYGTDGNPVPGANVTASNVDRFWCWSAASPVGSAVTDPTGHFTMTFEWCCGWLPWYWWEMRNWRRDPVLVNKINPILVLNPQLRVSPPTIPPSLGFTALNPQPLPPFANALRLRSGSTDLNPQPEPPGRRGGRIVAAPTALNPSTLESLRAKLLGVLPQVPEFERFCLWPWCAWWPWLDCAPNIIFKATQNCSGLTKVILDETVWQARDDISTELVVALTADADACTIPAGGSQPEGDCFLFTSACSVAAPDLGLTCDTNSLNGLAYPGSSDRPFTGVISIWGQFGTSAQADYYGVTYRPLQPCTTPPSSVPFIPVPAAALAAFQRTYFDATLAYPNQWSYPAFPPTALPVSGGGTAAVYESRQFYEASNPPANWGDVMTGRSWTGNVDAIAVIDTDGFFADGAYEFQIVGYTANGDGSITEVGPLPGCGQPNAAGLNDNNDFAIYFANPGAGIDTNPSAVISSLEFTVNGASQILPVCGILKAPFGAAISLAITLTASDTEGFLDDYGLTIAGGGIGGVPIPAVSGLIPPGSGYLTAITPGAQVGPTYAEAIAQGAVRPNWTGGQYVLTIPDATPLFPQSCAYELQLNVYKRNIVNCDGDDAYWDPAYYSFTVLFE